MTLHPLLGPAPGSGFAPAALPMLMLEDADRTDMFREQLVDLAQRYPPFALALERFDASPA